MLKMLAKHLYGSLFSKNGPNLPLPHVLSQNYTYLNLGELGHFIAEIVQNQNNSGFFQYRFSRCA